MTPTTGPPTFQLSHPHSLTHPHPLTLTHRHTLTDTLTQTLLLHAACRLVSVLLLLVGVELDHIVDSEDGHSGLSGEAKALNLGNSRLHHSSLEIVSDLALHQVKSRILEVLLTLHSLHK